MVAKSYEGFVRAPRYRCSCCVDAFVCLSGSLLDELAEARLGDAEDEEPKTVFHPYLASDAAWSTRARGLREGSCADETECEIVAACCSSWVFCSVNKGDSYTKKRRTTLVRACP